MSASPACDVIAHPILSEVCATAIRQVRDRVSFVGDWLVLCIVDLACRDGNACLPSVLRTQCPTSITSLFVSDGPLLRGRRFLLCDLLRDAFALAVVCIHRAVASISGGWIGVSALPNRKTVFCVPGSCLRMPHPAGRMRLS